MGKRGPTPKGEYSGQTAVLSTRITQDLRSLLEIEVENSGKTLSREIEHRLRRSFLEDEKISEAFGSRRNYALMKVISMVLEFWHNPSDLNADWTSDPVAYDQVCRKIDGVLKAMRPSGELGELSNDERALIEVAARSHPAGVIDELHHATSAIPIGGRRRPQVLSVIKGDLGEMLSRATESKTKKQEDRSSVLTSKDKKLTTTAHAKPKKVVK